MIMAKIRTIFFTLVAIFCFEVALCDFEAGARSAYSPRHTGMEPPGGPRRIEAMPGNSPSRTAEGGMGYIDAYGNTLEDRGPEEKKARRRPPPGAYGGYGAKETVRPLPEPRLPGKPLWKFD